MDVLEFNRRFMLIEEELALFPDTRVADPGWWDVVRHDVMKLVYARASDTPVEPPQTPSFAVRVRHKVTRLLLRARLELRIRLHRHDVLVYRAPRLLRGGRRVDTAMDQVLGQCEGEPLVIDTFPHRYDRRFASHTELAARPVALDALERRIRDVFAVELDLDHFVRHRLADHEIATCHYRRLLARVRPRLVLLTQNGVEKALFKAAREAGIICIEVQHGLIGNAHPAYAYPLSVHGVGHAMFPDGLFAFSDFWLNSCHYPVRWSAAIGNDEFVPPTLAAPPCSTDILVITAAKYNDRLCEWMDAIAPRLPARQFKFKLHPSQGAQMPAIQARLRHLPNVEVIGTDTTMAQALAAASDVVLIQSTAAYETVQASRRLVVIREFDSGTHANLFDLPGVHVITDIDELQQALTSARSIAPAPVFFKPFDASFARSILMRGTPELQTTSARPSMEQTRT